MNWRNIFFLIFFFALALATPVFASEANGTVDSSYKYAWGDQLGWINCAPTSTGGAYNGLNISSSTVSGYTWSTVGGWINFTPNGGGVTNDGNGTLGGYAWSTQKGWINMDGVTINPNTGKFSGIAGSSTSTAGRINFSCLTCDVRTDWRATSTPPICTSWAYSDWGSCSGGSQTRTIASALPSGCTGGSPVLSQSCSSGGGGGGGGSYTSPTAPTASTTTITPTPTTPKTVDVNSPEYQKWFTDVVKRADIVQDGVVDIIDFNSLMVNWGKTGTSVAANINQDGVVDIFDFNLLMVHWGQSEIKL